VDVNASPVPIAATIALSTGYSAFQALGRHQPDPAHRQRTLSCGKLLVAIHVHHCMTAVAQRRTAAAGGRDALANLSFREIQKFAKRATPQVREPLLSS
jgi:hypothetical protein